MDSKIALLQITERNNEVSFILWYDLEIEIRDYNEKKITFKLMGHPKNPSENDSNTKSKTFYHKV